MTKKRPKTASHDKTQIDQKRSPKRAKTAQKTTKHEHQNLQILALRSSKNSSKTTKSEHQNWQILALRSSKTGKNHRGKRASKLADASPEELKKQFKKVRK